MIEVNQDGAPLFPERAAQIIDAFLAITMFSAMAHGTDDDRRAATKAIVEQIAFEFPNDGFTLKSADRTRPQSKDAIGIVSHGKLWAWDWQNGDTKMRQVKPGQPAAAIFDQNPLPTAAVNHLNVIGHTKDPGPQQPGLPMPEPNVVVDGARWEILTQMFGKMVDAIENQAHEIAELREQLREHNEQLAEAIRKATEGIDAAIRNEDTRADALSTIGANVEAALKIARDIHDNTTRQAGEAERTSNNVHNAAVKVGEIAAGISPLINLLDAMRGTPKP